MAASGMARRQRQQRQQRHCTEDEQRERAHVGRERGWGLFECNSSRVELSRVGLRVCCCCCCCWCVGKSGLLRRRRTSGGGERGRLPSLDRSEAFCAAVTAKHSYVTRHTNHRGAGFESNSSWRFSDTSSAHRHATMGGIRTHAVNGWLAGGSGRGGRMPRAEDELTEKMVGILVGNPVSTP